ncbi:hypothetical protein [Plantactinospora sp. KLBMP9567]|uniref:hypothetical protein n=1 Tax=Plantactinospora sp. KLBMP9567 TaxID=3085900 RepID=UPI00298130A8|nr:hypothetical protein [Plantactinospora sp. KLBMP9567]MDW5330514.1 hypothetical protein [Plantactinospora sp. KLBMP9567]
MHNSIMLVADLLAFVTGGTFSVTHCTKWTAEWMDWLAIGLESLKVTSASLF